MKKNKIEVYLFIQTQVLIYVYTRGENDLRDHQYSLIQIIMIYEIQIIVYNIIRFHFKINSYAKFHFKINCVYSSQKGKIQL